MHINKGGITFDVQADQVFDLVRFWRDVANGQWEPNTFKIFSYFLNKDFCYVDVGAWIGPTVLYGSRLSKHCYAIEPDPIATEILNANISLNHFENITIFFGAINNRNGKTLMGNYLGLPGDSKSSILFANSNTAWVTDGVTLSKFFEMNKITNCNFIKMDVEGSEILILPEARDFLCSFDHTLYLSLHSTFFKNNEVMKPILDCLENVYKNLYLDDGTKINRDYIMQKNHNLEIVATNKHLEFLW
ncbi:MAG: FkbM family methyltransferase [Thermodesulfovibrionales bacterium]|nr:FkbM family methyltransferase [Thermodesulfovibrionales bacterium]